MEHRKVRHGEYGFIQSTPSAVPKGFSLVVLPSLPLQRIAYSVLMVDPHEGSQEHLILSAYHPPLDRQLCEQIRRIVSSRWPKAQSSFITDSVYEPKGPTCRCAVYLAQDGEPGEVAAAVAESIRSGTLDDIESVSVTVDGAPYSVALAWAGSHADAGITQGAG